MDTKQTSATTAVESAQGKALDAVADAKNTAVTAVTDAQTAATQAVGTVQANAIQQIESTKTDALKELDTKQTSATQAVDTARDKAIKQVNAATEAAKTAANEAATSAANAGQSAQQAADSLQELKDGIASGNFKGEKGDKGETGPQGPQGEPGPDNLVIITAAANATVQGEYIPDTAYSNALADIQSNKAVIIKLDNVPGRYYIPYSSSNAEILASAGTVSGSNQSIELYLIKWTAQTNTITLTGTKEGCIADGGTAGQVLVKKSDGN